MIKFAIHGSFFQNALEEYKGVCTDTNKDSGDTDIEVKKLDHALNTKYSE